MSHPTTDDVVAAATNLVPRIHAAREEGEVTRRVPPALAKAIAAAGLFQLHLPRSMGGPELPPLTAFRVIEELSKADGSVGWCTMIATAVSVFTGWLPAEVGRVLCGQPPDLRAAGSLRPQGQAYPVDGGYQVRGHWNFASGINHAKWLYCPCIVMEGETPRQTPAGTPAIRAMWVPAEAATIVDTWSVVGLCGTGSQDFLVDDVFVPLSHTSSLSDPPQQPGPLYHPRLLLVTVWTSTVANALGIARGAIESFIALATCTSSTGSPTLLRDRPFVQTRVAEAEAILSAARAYVVEAVGSAWEAVCAGVPDPSREIAQARLAITHGMHEAVRAIDLVFHAAGTHAIYRRNPLERYFRDIHVAVQHNAAYPTHIESAGKVFLGLRPSDMGW
jgi:alkylation response protein AidB-like acyl-CoA dehydrogenase